MFVTYYPSKSTVIAANEPFRTFKVISVEREGFVDNDQFFNVQVIDMDDKTATDPKFRNLRESGIVSIDKIQPDFA